MAPRRWHAVVLHYGRVEDTAACLASLGGLAFASVLVADNGTGAPELEALVAEDPRRRLVRCPGNGGYGAGNNLALRAAAAGGAEFVAVLNNDVEVEYPGVLRDAEAAFGAAPALAVVSPQVFYADRGWHPIAVNLRFERALFGLLGLRPALRRGQGAPEVTPTLSFSGCCWLAPLEPILRVGELREDLFLYHEEIEYSIRLGRAGLWCGQLGAGRGRVLHKGGTTAGVSPMQAYYSGRNLALLRESCEPEARRRVLLLGAARVTWMALRCVKRGRLHSARTGLRGFVDGVRGLRGPAEAWRHG